MGKTLVLTLNRPHRGNSYDGETAESITRYLLSLREETEADRLVIRAEGKNFCTGADLHWMARGPSETDDEARNEMRKIFRMYEAFLSLPIPIVALVQGKVAGGGMGLVSIADHVIATPDSSFSLPEKRLGLDPGIISPIVLSKIGEKSFHRLEEKEPVLASEALNRGIISEICESFPEIYPTPVKRKHALPELLSEMERMLEISAQRRRNFSRTFRT